MSKPLILRMAAVLLALVAVPALAAQTRFASADAAATAFAEAVATGDGEAMRKMLGDDYREVLSLREVSENDKLGFLSAWAESHRIVPDGESKASLEVGKLNWPMPIPIVKSAGGWSFDTPAGARELETRLIGRNELAAMEATLAYYDAQREYASEERSPGQGRMFAQRLRSSPGQRDGLYWPTAAGEKPSPIGAAYAATTPDGAYYGYFYRILKAQGKHAAGGAYDYVNNGRMNAGFALIAWPARYGHSGIMSFMVNQDGVVYQSNLGPSTAARARDMRRFDPDAGWAVVKPGSEVAAGAGK
jgi:hypothetical protein